jgi:serine/threonine protein kinase/WD40 repeat protein
VKQFPRNGKQTPEDFDFLETQSHTCRRCGASHPSDVAHGLCPRCLLAGLFEQAPEPRTGEQEGDAVGPYELVGLLGRGGMGSVWRARQLHPVEREVALKIINLGMDTRELVSRFEAERQSLAMMDHPNIARVYEAGATDAGRPYFAMELVDGEPVTDYCVSRTLPVEERLRLFLDICAAVAHAHRKGVLHRDLKPSNVMVVERTQGPQVKVIDFGIAKLLEAENDGRTFATRIGHAVGTPGYMSPEQAGAEPDVDTRSDVYSLGALLYEMLTGSPPLGRETFRELALVEVMRLIRELDPPRPSTRIGPAVRTGAPPHLRIARDLDRIVMKALARERDRRYGGAASLADDVRRFLDHEPVTATDPTLAYRAGKFVRKHRLPVAFATALFLGLVASTLLIARENLRARTAAAVAEAARLETLSTLADSYRTAGINASGERDDALAALWFTKAAATATHDASRTRNNRLRAALHAARTFVPVRKIERSKQVGCTLTFDAGSRVLHEGGFGLEHMFFDLETGAPLNFEFPLRAACFLPGGKQIAVSDGGAQIEIRDLTTLDVVERITNPDGKTTGIWSDHLGELLAFGDQRIHVWHRGVREFLGNARDHPLPVRLVAFSPGGERLLTIDRTSNLRVFDTAAADTGQPLFPPIHLAGAATYDVLLPAFTAADRLRVKGNEGMRILDAATGAVVERLPHLNAAIDFSPDGSLFSIFNSVCETSSGNPRFERPLGGPLFLPDSAAVYGTGTGEILDLRGHRIGKVCLSGYQRAIAPDGTLLAVRQGANITIYSLVQAEPFQRVIARDTGKIALSPDGRLFASGGWGGAHPTGTRTRAFFTADGQPAGPEIDTGSQNLCGIFSGAAGNLLSGGRRDPLEIPRKEDAAVGPGIIQLWNPATGARLAGPLEIPAEPWAMCRHPDGSWIAVLCADGSILRLEPDLSGFAEIIRLDIPLVPEPGELTRGQLVFSPDGSRLHANGFGSATWTIDPAAGKIIFTTPPRHGTALRLEVAGDLLFTPTTRLEDEWCFHGGTGEVLPLDRELRPYLPAGSRVSPDGRQLLLSGVTRVGAVDWRENKAAGRSFQADTGWISFSEFVPGTPWVLTAATSKTGEARLVLWDRDSGTELSPRWPLQGTAIGDFTTTPDGTRAILSIRNEGYLIVHLDEIHAAADHDDGLPTTDRLMLAEIRAGKKLIDSTPTMLDTPDAWLPMWRDFTARHPGSIRLKPPRETLLRWHRNQEAMHRGSNGRAAEWHRERIKALGAQ